ncbi:pectin lyase fold/virulence factor [Trichoderma velutinum]
MTRILAFVTGENTWGLSPESTEVVLQGDKTTVSCVETVDTPFEPGLSGGGGAGYVKNATYDTFYNNNNDWAIEINQYYGQSNQTFCDKYPSNMTISDVTFKNMWGTTSTKYDTMVRTLTCSSTEKCLNIAAYNISVTDPSGKTPQWICTNMDENLLDINCVPANS